MRRTWVSLAMFVLTAATAQAAGVKLGEVWTHSGMCEPSGAVAFLEGSFGQRFVVANDEDNIIRIVAADRSGPARAATRTSERSAA
jgi:hypothetical protein